jgi:uncharacterized repeat protein (TIGR02543 family)
MGAPKGRGALCVLTGTISLAILLGLWGCPDPAIVLGQIRDAQAGAVEHTVTYDGNGATAGSAPIDGTGYVRGDTVTVMGNTGNLAWYGRAYAGWNTGADGSGTTYTQGQTFTMGTADVTLYALWTILPTYTVTYDANGAASGSVPIDTTNYLEGRLVSVAGNSGNLANPPWGFDGWNTKADSTGTLYTQGQSFPMGNSSVTLYATWVTAFTVTYDANGATTGDVPVDATCYPQGHSVTVAGNTGSLARTDYAFGGWNTQADGNGTTCTEGQTRTMGTSNLTLYAKWIPECTVTYNANGATSGSAPVDPAIYFPGDWPIVWGNYGGLVKAGYAYTGWSRFPDGSGTRYVEGDRFAIASDVTLYARWVPAIWRVAGTIGTSGYSGDGGPATSALLNNPCGVAVDTEGNLYIADAQNYRIRMVSPGGTITTVAGTGVAGYSGDNGPATSARLSFPCAVAVDADGILYIADGQRIRTISGGTITTVAGTGVAGYSGDDGPATSAQLFNPTGVAVDTAGNLYIADSNNYRVRKVSELGTITTAAGTGTVGYSGDDGPATSAQINYPVGVAVDAAGSLYIAELYNHVIRKVSSGGTITTVAGTGVAGYSGDNGPAASAKLDKPSDVAVDMAGNLYIADYQNYRVRKVSAAGMITTVTGSGAPGFVGDNEPATSAALGYVSGLAVDSKGHLYLADQWFNTIREATLP